MSYTNNSFTPDSDVSSSPTASETYSKSSTDHHHNEENDRIPNGSSHNGSPGNFVGGPNWSNIQNNAAVNENNNKNNSSEESYPPPKIIMDEQKQNGLKEKVLDFIAYESPVGFWVNNLVVFVLIWGSVACILGAEGMPGGNIFSLVIVYGSSRVGGKLATLVKLPELLGMLVAGILLRSVPGVNVVGIGINNKWSSVIRSIALVIILNRAGLSLNPQKLKELSFMMFRLAIIPCLVEVATVTVVAHLLLGLPWLWGVLLGFALSAVSPAVIIPGMLTLGEQGLGVEKGIPTLVIAAGSIEDVFAISGFTVMLGITVTSSSLTWQILQGPVDILIGVVYGIVTAYVSVFLHSKPKLTGVTSRFLLVLGFGLVALFGSKRIKFSGAGAVGCLIQPLVAGTIWRNRGYDEKELAAKFAALWGFIQYYVFCLIGAQIDIPSLDGTTVGLGIVIIIIGTTLRCLVSFVCVFGGNLTLKERIFVALTKIPKATVQASIGSIALDYAHKFAADTENSDLYVLYGSQVLILCVLIIVISAPIGAGIIQLTGKKLLTPEDPDADKKV